MAAWKSLDIDRDTSGVDALVDRALRSAPNNAQVLSLASGVVRVRHRPRESYELSKRATLLDPRSSDAQVQASVLARSLRDWNAAARFAGAALRLDSTDEAAWRMRLERSYYVGDTVAMQQLLVTAARRLPENSFILQEALSNAGLESGKRYLRLSPEQAGIMSAGDSLHYYAIKQNVCVWITDDVCARVHGDSLMRLFARHTWGGYNEVHFVSLLAFAQANAGPADAARASLRRILTASRSYSTRELPTDFVTDVPEIAGAYVRLGEPAMAIRWLEASLQTPDGGTSARYFEIHPKLQTLRGTPEFEVFLRAHPK